MQGDSLPPKAYMVLCTRIHNVFERIHSVGVTLA